jgi:GT2 family glycosyltransferase
MSRIWKFQPFSTTKELGKEFNGHCALVPGPDDWILILDYDAMILAPEAYTVIEKAIERYPDTVIFGARCNRISYPFQRLLDQPDQNDSIRHHLQIARRLAEDYSDGECQDARTVAGFFLLFRKSYWEKSPFQDGIFDANGNLFDYNFCRMAMKEGWPVRIIQGAYLWHTYRLEKDYRDQSHLR